MNAGTPCPKDGLIGNAAKVAWEMEALTEDVTVKKDRGLKGLINVEKDTKVGIGAVLSVLGLLLFL